MRPYVICHMNTSVDGRIWHSRWRPAANRDAGLFERIHQELGNGSWLIGRVTGSEYAKAEAYPAYTGETFPREPWFVRRDAAAYGIALDARGKIAWGRSDIGGDPIVAVLTKQVSDAHLAGLHRDGVSYIFAGERELDLRLALEILNRELGIERLLLEGGGKSNGSFLRVARPWPGRRRRSCIHPRRWQPIPSRQAQPGLAANCYVTKIAASHVSRIAALAGLRADRGWSRYRGREPADRSCKPSRHLGRVCPPVRKQGRCGRSRDRSGNAA